MKKLFLTLILIICFVSTAFGAIDSHGGFAFITKTKTDSDIVGTETDTIVWTPASGMRITLLGVKFSSDTATTLLVETGSTAVIPTSECTASGQVVIGNGVPIWQGAANETLTYTTDIAGRHSILLWGYESN